MVGFDEAATPGEAKSGALGRRFGGDKGIENAGAKFGGDARNVVASRWRGREEGGNVGEGFGRRLAEAGLAVSELRDEVSLSLRRSKVTFDQLRFYDPKDLESAKGADDADG